MMKEKEISLTDLLVEILLRWRGFLLLMLVGAVLFGVVGYVHTYRASKTQEARVEAAKNEIAQKEAKRLELERKQLQELLANMTLEEAIKEQLTELQIRDVEYVMTYESMYYDKMAYQEKSLYMQLDPNNVKRAELTFYVSASEGQNSHDIEKIYEDVVSSGEAIEYIAEQIGCEAGNISEGISLGRTSSAMVEENTFRMAICHYDETVCRNMVQAVIDFVNLTHDELAPTLGAHEVTVIYQSFATVVDTNILAHQRSYLSDLDAVATTIANAKAKFVSEQWDYYDFLVNGELTGLREEYESKLEENEEDEEETPEKIVERGVTVTPGISKKYLVLGALLMAFVYAFIIFVKYVLNNRLKDTDSLTELYDLPQLGMIPAQANAKKPFDFVDEWIISVRDRGKRKFTREEALELSIVAVKMAAGKETIDKICLLGCDLKKQSLEVCETIQGKLSDENVRVSILSNVLYDAQAMSELEDEKGVVLVEHAGVTLYSEIAQELELMNRQGIKVLGGIVVG